MNPMLNLLPRMVLPLEIALGKGSLVRLRFLEAQRVVLITGASSARASGILAKAEAFLSASKVATTLVEGVCGDPTFNSVSDLASKMREVRPDWIVAMGGGAVLDAAKIARVLTAAPDADLVAAAAKPHTLTIGTTGPRLLAIPTSSGTGSEATSISVLTEVQSRRKRPIVSHELLPHAVVLDPTLTIGLPPRWTAAAAVDAMAHAAESYCSPLAQELPSQLALAAGRLIVEYLPVALAEPSNLVAREKLQVAAFYAGASMNVASTGNAHALAHALQASAPVPHAVAVSLFLVPVLRSNAQVSPRVLQWLNGVGLRDLDSLTAWVDQIRSAGSLPSGWSQCGSVDPGVVAATAMEDPCHRTNPVRQGVEDLRALLEATR